MPKLLPCCLLALLLIGSAALAETKAPSQATNSVRHEVLVAPYNGRPTVFIDGKPNPLVAYSPVAGRRMELFKKQTQRFFSHKMGAYFVSIPSAKKGEWGDGPFWVGDEVGSEPLVEPNFSLDEVVQTIIKGDPDAFLIIRDIPAEPSTWRAMHPGQLVVNETGERLPVPSLASDLYWQMAARHGAAVVKYCQSRPWADRIIGYWDGLRMEGTHEPLARHWLFDNGPAMAKAWNARYPGRPLPKDKLRGSVPDVSNLLYWQDAAGNLELRDYLLLSRDLFQAGARQIMQAMQEATQGKQFLVYDALKQSMLGWSNHGFFDACFGWPLAYSETMAGSGHMNVADLLDAPGFDGLITPHDYQARGIGGVYEPEGAVDSMILRGKLFFSEMDTRSYTGKDINFPARDDREFAAITWRNLATSWTRGFNSYYMDVYEDWFASEGIHSIIQRQTEVMKESIEWPHETMPGIAMILDDTAVLETNGAGNFFNEAIMWEQKMGMARSGVPYRIYLLDDLKLSNFPRHRAFYFPNLFRVDAKRLALLKEKVFRDGNVVLWGPGSGISDGGKTGGESASKLTGFTFDYLPVNYQRRTLITNFEHPITRGLRADTIIGGPLSYGPLLFPKDGVSLGEAWTKGGRLESGLAVKEMDGWHSVFTTTVPLPADLWRGLARFAGAHVYSETNDVLMADKSVVALHSIQSGRKRIALPGRFTVHDVISGEEISRDANEIVFDLKAPETRVFRLIHH